MGFLVFSIILYMCFFSSVFVKPKSMNWKIWCRNTLGFLLWIFTLQWWFWMWISPMSCHFFFSCIADFTSQKMPVTQKHNKTHCMLCVFYTTIHFHVTSGHSSFGQTKQNKKSWCFSEKTLCVKPACGISGELAGLVNHNSHPSHSLLLFLLNLLGKITDLLYAAGLFLPSFGWSDTLQFRTVQLFPVITGCVHRYTSVSFLLFFLRCYSPMQNLFGSFVDPMVRVTKWVYWEQISLKTLQRFFLLLFFFFVARRPTKLTNNLHQICQM